MKLTKTEKARRYYTVVDYQGEHISYHRSREAAEKAIKRHIACDHDNDQTTIDYRIYEPEND